MKNRFGIRPIFTWWWVCLLGPVLAVSGQEAWTRKENRDEMARMDAGRIAEAVTSMEAYLAEHPDDRESLFGIAAAMTISGDVEEAWNLCRRALASGVPIQRFLAGPRRWFEPLLAYPEFHALAQKLPHHLVHGPLLGVMTDHGVRIWVRTFEASPIRVEVYPADAADVKTRATAAGITRSDKDFTVVLEVDGLKPATDYVYDLVVDNRRLENAGQFRTFPKPGSPARFRVAFGGGAAYTPPKEFMWATIQRAQPDALVLLGDNVYIDHPEQPAVQRYCYYRRQSHPFFRELTANVPVYAIWDDHDFIRNDAWGGPQTHTPVWKPNVWRVFQENWNNPAYGDGPAQPGCWFSFSIGDVDFFLLDGRYYRTDPKSPSPSMLGPVQKEWLFRRLSRSQAVFKILASPVPWSKGTKPGSLDTWDGYAEEREEIFRFVESQKIPGVFLLSADRHRSDAWKIERPDGYDLYEFESSRLTNIHSHRTLPEALFSYNEKCSFGMLEFDTTRPDPQVTYRIVNIDGKPIYSLTLRRSRLEFSGGAPPPQPQ